MTDWRKDVKKDSPFLYYFDIEGMTPLKLTITGFKDIEAYCPGKNEQGMMWCVEFKQCKKVLGLNITNGNLVEHLHGVDKEGWIGKDVELRVAECKDQKCIRVDAPGATMPVQCPKWRWLDTKNEEGK